MDNNVVKTEYGLEITWAETAEYCGKILMFERAGGKTPLHFHKTRNKNWFVNAGQFKIQWVNTEDGKVYAQVLDEGSTFFVPALMPVMLESTKDNSVIAEVGSGAVNNDVYRLN